MYLIGITGGIASGKSTVSNLIKKKGFTVVDADKVSREVLKKNSKAFVECVNQFGSFILNQDGDIDREKLGEIIFNDPLKRKKLNAIMHSRIRVMLLKEVICCFCRNEKIVFIDIPLLIESKLAFLFRELIVVFVDKEVQLKRLMTRNSFTKAQAESRINSQMDLSKKLKFATRVIDNNGTIDSTTAQLNDFLNKLNLNTTSPFQLLCSILICFSGLAWFYFR